MQVLWLGLGVMALIVIALVAMRIKERSEGRLASNRTSPRADLLRRELALLDERYAFASHAVCHEGRGAVGLAERDKLLVFLSGHWTSSDPQDARGEVRTQLVNMSDVLDVEVVESTYGGAKAAGGVPVGMARGIDLKVVVSNVVDPVHVVGFLPTACEIGSVKHRDAQMRAYRWQGLIRALVASRARVPSVNDQLQELDRAIGEGRMSVEEAKKAKAMIMSQRILSRAPARPQPSNREMPV